MRINRERLEDSMERLGRVGATPRGGLTRLALTDEDRRGRDLLVEWMRGAGLHVTVDQMGNIFGLRPGADALPPVLMGSHADSVPTGGKYDGQLGVLCALEAIRSLNDARTGTRHPVGMAIFTNEEGARFQPAMIGSGSDGRKDPAGGRLQRAVTATASASATSSSASATCGSEPCVAAADARVPRAAHRAGAAPGGAGALGRRGRGHRGHRVVAADHPRRAGPRRPTPMRIRHDALVAAAEVVRGVRAPPAGDRRRHGQHRRPPRRRPNIPNAIPGRVALSIDLRDPDDTRITRALGALDRTSRDAARREGVRYELEHYWRVPRTDFDPEVVDAVERAARSLGCGHRRILSGAGHDAQYMAAIAPTGMVFVPVEAPARSHCEEEFTAIDDIEHGANTLLLAAADLAQPA